MAYEFLKDKTVLITGGTGSFGQHCTKMLLKNSEAKKVIVFSRCELKQSQMQTDLADYCESDRLRFFIGDVRDLERLRRAFNKVDYVIHAAALKQVPALEYNPFEAIKTNILGTKNVIDAAIDEGVEKVMLLSTDKAANPANLYGATKLCAERLMISGNAYSGGKTKLSAVRYGNVFGSRGSLIQIIKQQRETGKINLTHEEMTRFWISLEEGVNFVLMGLEKMEGGEIFIPKIPSMKILDMIKILAPNCTIKNVGIRPGEKLHEILVTSEESRHTREFANHYIIIPRQEWWSPEKNMGGETLPENFIFSSDKNELQLNKETLEKILNDFSLLS
ncbi:MAG: UDP-N-acetylglucosamine 4,6-dehydratase (inverting) [Candidatus Staskawiczbacteria bacterium]|nr:UDP-N-acetylglucosamine 4,6-dehydratase (inverting) [Candidatus Staskawiczbacteria bacterium]